MAIVINGSGTVTGLAVGGLPDGTVDAGTLATDSVDSAELIDGAVDDSHIGALTASKLTGTVATARLPAGSVVQVVQGTMNGDIFNTTSTSKTATGRSLSITPTTSGNKMLVEITGLMYNQGGSSAWGTVQIKDTTNGTYSAEHNKTGRGLAESHYTACHLFTTASTSSHNYELYSGVSDAGNKQFDNTIITIMEIAA